MKPGRFRIRNDSSQMLPKSGTYAIILLSCTQDVIQVGRLGALQLKPGFYIYIGSAFGPGGLRARISHHKSISKRPRWHVDYLRALTCLQGVWYTYDSLHREHQWAEVFERMRTASMPLGGFGSSDCNCKSHLFFYKARPSGKSFSRRIHSKFCDHDRVHIIKNPSPTQDP